MCTVQCTVQGVLYAWQNKRTDPQKGALHTITGSMVRFASKSPQIYQCYFLVKKIHRQYGALCFKIPSELPMLLFGQKNTPAVWCTLLQNPLRVTNTTFWAKKCTDSMIDFYENNINSGPNFEGEKSRI